MPELRRYLLMPVAFDSRSHILEIPGEAWEADIAERHMQNRQRLIAKLEVEYGKASVDTVVENMTDLGQDPWSCIGWHIPLWLQVKDAYLTGAYYPAAVGAGALGERILSHLLIDLVDLAPEATDKDRRLIDKNGMGASEMLAILRRWKVAEPEALDLFDQLRVKRNRLVHFDPDLYGNLRDRTLEMMRLLRDAINAQFSVLLPRRLIPNHGRGNSLLRKAAEAEPFVRMYVLPRALSVSPRYALRFVPPGVWEVAAEEPVFAEVDTDEEFVRHLGSIPEPQMPDGVDERWWRDPEASS